MDGDALGGPLALPHGPLTSGPIAPGRRRRPGTLPDPTPGRPARLAHPTDHGLEAVRA